MGRVEKTVFISYRRTNAPWALAIFQNLTDHGFDVFFDFTGVASGDFERVILENVRARAHFLLLLTPSALERCGEPGDWVRREIETALDSRRNIVPLVLEGFDFSNPAIASQLTGKLSALKHYNQLRVPVDFFSEAMDRLRERYLNVPLDAVLHPASSIAVQVARDHQTAAQAAPAVQDRELTAQQWFEQALSAQLKRDFEGALRDYDEAIRLSPNFAEVYNNRGNTRHDQGDLEGALRDYNEAIRLRPDAPMFYNRGIARYDQGDLEGALQDYNEAIRRRPDYADAFTNRGNARQGMGDLEGALRDYNEAIRLKPDSVEAYTNRGMARLSKGDLQGALRDCNQAFRLKPDYALAYVVRGDAHMSERDVDGALRDYNEAARLKPGYAAAYYGRGRAHKARGDLEGALRDLDKAILYNPAFAAAYCLRAAVRQVRGERDAALRDYNEAIRLKPDLADAYYLRSTL